MGKNWRAYWLLTHRKWQKTISFKTNLVLQIGGMMINNLAFLFVWYLLFARFGTVNGYSFLEIVLIQGYVAVFFAVFFWFVGGVARYLSEYLEEDKFLDLQLYQLHPNAAAYSGVLGNIQRHREICSDRRAYAGICVREGSEECGRCNQATWAHVSCRTG
jgi:hypothetical protein